MEGVGARGRGRVALCLEERVRRGSDKVALCKEERDEAAQL
jgi:hypothetical protein